MASAPTQRLNSSENEWAADYAHRLLHDLGLKPQPLPRTRQVHPALAWAESGLMQLTGQAHSAARMCPAPLASCARGALAALQALAPAGDFSGLDGAALLTERAALMGLQRRGDTSPGGSCRLLPLGDSHIAINLARASDWELLPAWLECEVRLDWSALAAALRAHAAPESLLTRGRELGLAVAAMQPPATASPSWQRALLQGSPRRQQQAPLVLDLSALWAGPLCAQLLGRSGARVIKVEDHKRLDGARRGHAGFHDLLNEGKESLVLDLHQPAGVGQLLALIRHADIVIEASRPRALRQLGIDAEALVSELPGLTWVSVSGYGRAEPQADWVAFGDDAGVAAGLSWLMQQVTGEVLFCGDAIADPLTGLHAAVAAWASYRQGGGRLVSLALTDVTGHCIAFNYPGEVAALKARQQRWEQLIEAESPILPAANVRRARAAAALPGAHNDALFREFVLPC